MTKREVWPINNVTRLMLPYVFKRIDSRTFQMKNRDYVDILDPVTFDCDPCGLKNVFANVYDDALFLYNDAEESRAGYHTRLERLFRHVVSGGFGTTYERCGPF